MNRLAKPVFNGAPTDTAKIVDVYETVDPEVRNSLTSKLSAFGEGLSESLSGTVKVASEVSKSFLKNGINLANAQERIQKALGGSRSDINALSKTLQDVVFSDLTGVDSATNYVHKANGLFDSVKMITTQGERLTNVSDYRQASAIMSIVGDMTRNPIFETFDLGAETALLRGVITEMGKWGVPQLIDDTLSNADERVRWHAVKRSSSDLMNTADIDTVQAIINRVGAAALTTDSPEFPMTFLSRYRFKPSVTPADYPAKLTQLFEVMDKLMPEWCYTYRAGEAVWNYAVLSYASEDVKTLMSSDPVYRAAVLTAGKYRSSKNVITLFKKMHPLSSVGFRA